MNWLQFFLILSAVLIAPNVDSKDRAVLAAIYLFLAIGTYFFS